MEIAGIVSLKYPELLLLGGLVVVAYIRFLRRKNLWRTITLILAVGLLTYPYISRTTKSVDIVVLADRSRSITDKDRSRQAEVIRLIETNLDGGDRLGVVSFNEKSYVEKALSAESSFDQFTIPYSQDASDLSEGLKTSLALCGSDRNAKILILSDGKYTGREPTAETRLAAQNGVPIYYRNLEHRTFSDLSVELANVAPKVLVNERFQIAFNVFATENFLCRYRLLRDGSPSGAESGGWTEGKLFKQGRNQLSFDDILKTGGIHHYRLEVETIEDGNMVASIREKVTANNAADAYVRVIDEDKILVLNNTGSKDNVVSVLSSARPGDAVPVDVLAIDNFRYDLGFLQGYKAVVMNNVSIMNLSYDQIASFRDFVMQEGGGILICGGKKSFGMGGYYKSQLEEVLPVSLEMRKESRKMAAAISIVMDRSGSMAMPTASGQSKMHLANSAAAASAGMLTSKDSISVIAVDSSAHVIVAQRNFDNPDAIISKISRVESMGGGIFVYTGLRTAAAQIINSPQINKHIILFADAADAEEPGDYIELLAKLTRAGVTVSVIGLGNPTDPDAEFLRDVARRGNGQCYFTNDARKLPQIFTMDTMQSIRKSFVNEQTPHAILAASRVLSANHQWSDFVCGEYNMTFPKPKADVAIQTADSDEAPILSFWQRGVGRAVALAFDTDGEFSEQIDFPNILLDSVRWAMGSQVYDSFHTSTVRQGNNALVKLEVSDEERAKLSFAKLTVFGPGGETQQIPLQWDNYNQLSAGFKLTRQGCYRGIVTVGTDMALRIDPVSLPGAPEFTARISGGRELVDVRELFDRERRTVYKAPAIIPLLIVLLLFFIVDIAETRFGILAFLRGGFRRLKVPSTGAVSRYFKEKRNKIFNPMRRAAIKEPDKETEKKIAEAAAEKKPPPTEAMSYLDEVKEKTKDSLEK